MRRLRWRNPKAPSRARVFAISSPITVSMLAPITGRPASRPAARGMLRSTSRRVRTGLLWGRTRKSSKVRPWKRASLSVMGCLAVLGEPLDHADERPPPGRKRVGHLVHEGPHEEDPAAVHLEEVLLGEGVGDGGGVEPLPLVVDRDLEGALGEGEL